MKLRGCNMLLRSQRQRCSRGPNGRGACGFTLVEYLVCFFIATFTITTIATGYLLASQRSMYQAAASAAQRLVNDRLEQVRGAQWDLYANPPVTNVVDTLAGSQAVTLNLLQAGVNDTVPGLLTTTIQTLAGSVPLKQITVECAWTNLNGFAVTNRAVTLMAPRT